MTVINEDITGHLKQDIVQNIEGIQNIDTYTYTQTYNKSMRFRQACNHICHFLISQRKSTTKRNRQNNKNTNLQKTHHIHSKEVFQKRNNRKCILKYGGEPPRP